MSAELASRYLVLTRSLLLYRVTATDKAMGHFFKVTVPDAIEEQSGPVRSRRKDSSNTLLLLLFYIAYNRGVLVSPLFVV